MSPNQLSTEEQRAGPARLGRATGGEDNRNELRPMPSSGTKVSRGNGALTICYLMVGVSAYVFLPIVGRLSVLEVASVVLLPLSLRRTWHERLVRRLVWTGSLVLAVDIVVGVSNGSPIGALLKSVANYGILVSLAVLLVYALNGLILQRLTPLILGAATANALVAVISPSIDQQVSLWKFGLGFSATIILFAVVDSRWFASRRVPLVIATGALVTTDFVLGSRSLGLLTALAAVAAFGAPRKLGTKRPDKGADGRDAWTLARVSVVLALAGYGLSLLYEATARAGVFGTQASAKIIAQSGDYGILVGGRKDVVILVFAFIRSPFVGYGPNPANVVTAQESAENWLNLHHYAITQGDVGEFFTPGIITLHSVAMGLLVVVGIFAMPMILVIIKGVWCAGRAGVRSGSMVVCFLFVTAAWHVLASPLGDTTRFPVALGFAIGVSAYSRRPQRVEMASDKPSSALQFEPVAHSGAGGPPAARPSRPRSNGADGLPFPGPVEKVAGTVTAPGANEMAGRDRSRVEEGSRSRAVGRNLSWMLLDRALQLGGVAAVNVVVVRALGPSDYAVYGLATATFALLLPVTLFGQLPIIRELSRQSGASDADLRRLAGRFGLASAIVCVLVVLGLTQVQTGVFHRAHEELAIVSLAFVIRPLAVVGWFYQAQLRNRVPVVWESFATVVTAGLRIAICIWSPDVRLLCWVLVLESFISCMGLYVTYLLAERRTRNVSPTLSTLGSDDRRHRPSSRRLISQSVTLLVAALSVVIYLRVDQLLLGVFSSSRQLGLYSAVASVAEAALLVPALVSNVFLPIVSRFYTFERDRYVETIRTITTLLLWGGVAVAITGYFLSPLAVRLLYGRQFSDAGPLLQILFCAAPFACLGVAESLQTVNEHLEKAAMARILTAAALNISLNALLIPRYGATSAAYLTVLAQAVAACLGNALSRRTRRILYLQIRAASPFALARELRRVKAIAITSS